MTLSNFQKNKHLLCRAGFGIKPAGIEEISNTGVESMYAKIEKASLKKPQYIDVADDTVKGLLAGFQAAGNMMKDEKQLTDEQKTQLRKESVEGLKSLALTWMEEMVFSDAQLLEKMSLFWHGHFACRNLNVYYQQLMLHEIRTNALGNFRDLLKGVSKSAAMIFFLNNIQNRKDHPNENFAREVMELFTLGRGNYSEDDVKEAARAFTGWSTKLDGTFVVRNFWHDTGDKKFLGRQGNFSGDDILNMLLAEKKTAYFITKKIYKFFVNENVDDEIVKTLAGDFYNSDYDIKKLVRNIFTSSWFYEEKNMACLIKSPVELVIGMRRLLQITFEQEAPQLFIQKLLGQQLFYPPNVAGWPGGKNWIDSSSLLFRMRLPEVIYKNEAVTATAKTDDDLQMGRNESTANGGFKLTSTIKWTNYLKQFDNKKLGDVYDMAEQIVLQTKPGTLNRKLIEEKNYASTEEYIKKLTISFMCTPEYQLC